MTTEQLRIMLINRERNTRRAAVTAWIARLVNQSVSINKADAILAALPIRANAND